MIYCLVVNLDIFLKSFGNIDRLVPVGGPWVSAAQWPEYNLMHRPGKRQLVWPKIHLPEEEKS